MVYIERRTREGLELHVKGERKERKRERERKKESLKKYDWKDCKMQKMKEPRKRVIISEAI